MLEALINPKAIKLDLQSEDKDEVLEELTEVLVSLDSSLDRLSVIQSLLAREEKMSTGVVHGIAIPHAISDKISSPLCAVGISKKGIDFESLDGKLVHIFFLILFPENDVSRHLEIMQRFALVFSDPNFYKEIIDKTSEAQVAQAIFAIEESL